MTDWEELEFVTNGEFIEISERRKGLFGFFKEVSDEYGRRYLGSGDCKHYILKGEA